MKLWIARNTFDMLKLFFNKPHSFKSYEDEYGIEYEWSDNDGPIGSIDIGEDLFPEVTFENSPQQIEIKLVKEE